MTTEVTSANFSTIIPDTLIAVIHQIHAEGAFGAKGYKGGISRNNPVLEDLTEETTHIDAVAEALGFDLAKVGYIADISVTPKSAEKDKSNRLFVYTPSIKASPYGEVILAWGKQEVALSGFSKDVSVTFVEDSYISAEVEFTHANVLYSLQIPLRVIKGTKLTRKDARSLYSAGRLHEVLQSKALNVTEIEAGSYTIIETRVNVGFQGKTSHDVKFAGNTAWFTAPKKLQEQLSASFKLPTVENPWTISLGGVKTTTFGDGRQVTYREVKLVTTKKASANLKSFILEESLLLPSDSEDANDNDELEVLATKFVVE